MRAREEVAEVIAELAQLEVPAVQLVVHRGQLFVGGLELLLGGLQLLVGALQLLVARLRLLGGGTQLFHGRLVLFANGLQMLVRVGKLPGELGQPTLARCRRSRLARSRRFPGRGLGGQEALIEEQDQVVATVFRPFRRPQRDHLEADFPEPAVRLDL